MKKTCNAHLHTEDTLTLGSPQPMRLPSLLVKNVWEAWAADRISTARDTGRGDPSSTCVCACMCASMYPVPSLFLGQLLQITSLLYTCSPTQILVSVYSSGAIYSKEIHHQRVTHEWPHWHQCQQMCVCSTHKSLNIANFEWNLGA